VKPETITDQLQSNRRWRPALMSYFLRRVGNHAEAEDLTQDVFARLLASGAEAQAHHGYIFQVASNLLADRARRAKIRSAYRDDLKSDPEQGIEALDPHRLAASREAIAIFRRNLAGLSARTESGHLRWPKLSIGKAPENPLFDLDFGYPERGHRSARLQRRYWALAQNQISASCRRQICWSKEQAVG
jgi:RNA polymerase sigma-70 factor (ECF subfamily)